jgi:hypothetical protein
MLLSGPWKRARKRVSQLIANPSVTALWRCPRIRANLHRDAVAFANHNNIGPALVADGHSHEPFVSVNFDTGGLLGRLLRAHRLAIEQNMGSLFDGLLDLNGVGSHIIVRCPQDLRSLAVCLGNRNLRFRVLIDPYKRGRRNDHDGQHAHARRQTNDETVHQLSRFLLES